VQLCHFPQRVATVTVDEAARSGFYFV